MLMHHTKENANCVCDLIKKHCGLTTKRLAKVIGILN